MATYRLDIAYDGAGFRGYARNTGVRSVQGDLESLLTKIAGVPLKTVVAGRTDAGVHARHNVVSFETDADLDTDRVARSVSTSFGGEIIATAMAVVPDGFHARFSATWRAYRYSVDDSGSPNPLTRTSVWAVHRPLDVDAMNRAAAAFVGDHDFASLCRRREGHTTQRTVLEARWSRDIDGIVEYRVRAKAFCHQMVRSMVAMCVDIGRGAVDGEAVPGILAARDRHVARGAAPPHGLVLWEVGYD